MSAAFDIDLCRKNKTSVNQGDQIGRILGNWEIAFFCQSIENYKSSKNSWDTSFQQYQICINLDKTLLGLHFGRLFRQLIWSTWCQ
jgi:hypothetical protein